MAQIVYVEVQSALKVFTMYFRHVRLDFWKYLVDFSKDILLIFHLNNQLQQQFGLYYLTKDHLGL